MCGTLKSEWELPFERLYVKAYKQWTVDINFWRSIFLLFSYCTRISGWNVRFGEHICGNSSKFSKNGHKHFPLDTSLATISIQQNRRWIVRHIQPTVNNWSKQYLVGGLKTCICFIFIWILIFRSTSSSSNLFWYSLLCEAAKFVKRKMAVKSTTPSNEQLEMDQMAEAELERLQKQVYWIWMCLFLWNSRKLRKTYINIDSMNVC